MNVKIELTGEEVEFAIRRWVQAQGLQTQGGIQIRLSENGRCEGAFVDLLPEEKKETAIPSGVNPNSTGRPSFLARPKPPEPNPFPFQSEILKGDFGSRSEVEAAILPSITEIHKGGELPETLRWAAKIIPMDDFANPKKDGQQES